MLLVLDLDETLIYASEQELEGLAWDFRASGYYVYKRPHVDEFLSYCARSFEEVAVWTSASRGYAQQVVAQVFGVGYPLSWMWAIPIETIKRRIASTFGHLKQPAVLDDTVYRLRIGPLHLLQNSSAPFLRFIIPIGMIAARGAWILTTWRIIGSRICARSSVRATI